MWLEWMWWAHSLKSLGQLAWYSDRLYHFPGRLLEWGCIGGIAKFEIPWLAPMVPRLTKLFPREADGVSCPVGVDVCMKLEVPWPAVPTG